MVAVCLLWLLVAGLCFVLDFCLLFWFVVLWCFVLVCDLLWLVFDVVLVFRLCLDFWLFLGFCGVSFGLRLGCLLFCSFGCLNIWYWLWLAAQFV